MRLRACRFEYQFPRPVLVMGILNVTPDSFSDGGKYFDTDTAVRHGLRLAAEGADIIDVGGESTRPQATPVPEEEELRRVLPVVKVLAKALDVPISIDTMKPSVAARAVEVGASIINDVGANREDEAMWRLAAETGAGYVCMHMQGLPATMQIKPEYSDVVREVVDFLRERIQRVANCGVAADQLILDPGIGFGKRLEHNLELLASLEKLTGLARPVLVGVSRKSFISRASGRALDEDRLPGSLACAALALQAGVQLLRVHDVAETMQAVRVTEAILAMRKN
jgi:dihydropteroate synthase